MGPAPANLDWLFSLIGWVLAALGGVALLWALFRDRSRGRRRCPTCWYDMAGVPGLVCPECGKDAQRESRTRRTRRRWRTAALAALLLCVAFVTARAPGLKARGWRHLFPTTVLIAALPYLDAPDPAAMITPYGPPAERSLSESFFLEITEARDWDSMYGWQRSWLLGRCIAGDRQRPPRSAAWRETYGQVLASAHWEFELGRLTGDEVRALPLPFSGPPVDLGAEELQRLREALSLSQIRSRARWPAGVPLRVSVDQCWALQGFVERELTFLAELPGAAPVTTRVHSMRWLGGFFDRWEFPVMGPTTQSPWGCRARRTGRFRSR